MNIDIYSRQDCGQCDEAKTLLKNKNIVFTEHNLDNETATTNFKMKYPSVRSLPFILIDDAVVGGVRNLREYISNKAEI